MIPNPQTVANWTAKAEAYDRLSRRWDIFSRLSERLVDSLPDDLAGPVLDIGAGTGLTSEVLLARRPKCESILIEPAEGMMALARRRLAGQRVRFLNMGLGEAVASGEAADSSKAAAGHVHAVAAVASVSMQFLNIDEVLGVLARVLAPGGYFAFNLWYHHWEETVHIPGMREWRAAAQAACGEAGLPTSAESTKIPQPAKTRAELDASCQHHGFRLRAEHRDTDLTPSAFGVDDEAMNPDWPIPGCAAQIREGLLRRMHELLAGKYEPLVSTRFLLQR